MDQGSSLLLSFQFVDRKLHLEGFRKSAANAIFLGEGQSVKDIDNMYPAGYN